MVRIDLKTETVKNIHQRNTSDDWKNGESGIVIASWWRRCVWTREFQQKYIDSIQKGNFPGIYYFIKDHNCATAYQNPWKVLDGGNRMRAIRDYIQDKYVDLNGNKYSKLTSDERTDFNTILIPCQEITIEKDDEPEEMGSTTDDTGRRRSRRIAVRKRWNVSRKHELYY